MPIKSNFTVNDLNSLTTYLANQGDETIFFEHNMFVCATQQEVYKNLLFLVRELLARPFPSDQSVEAIERNIIGIPNELIDYWVQSPDEIKIENPALYNAKLKIQAMMRYLKKDPKAIVAAAYVHDILFQGGGISKLTTTVGYIKLLEAPIPTESLGQIDRIVEIASKSIIEAKDKYALLISIVNNPDYHAMIDNIGYDDQDEDVKAFKNYLSSSCQLIEKVYSSLEKIGNLIDQSAQKVNDGKQIGQEIDEDGYTLINKIENEMKRLLIFSSIYTNRCFILRDMMLGTVNWQVYANQLNSNKLFSTQYPKGRYSLKSIAHDVNVPE